MKTRISTILIVTGLVAVITSIVYPAIGTLPLIAVLGLTAALQLMMWFAHFDWLTIASKFAFSKIAAFNASQPYIGAILSLWNEFAPVEEKSGPYKKIIVEASSEPSTKIDAIDVALITHKLRTWISQSERRKQIEEERARLAREYAESQNFY